MKDITKKLKYLLFVMCFALLFVVKTDITDADTSAGGGSTGVNVSCHGDWCQWANVGLRVTIVNKESGNRCYYNPTTGKICDIGYQSGAILSGSQDFWFKHYQQGDGYCYEYSNKITKKEFLEGASNGYVQNCQNIHTLPDLGLPRAASDEYYTPWGNWWITDENGGISADEQPQNFLHSIVPQLECLQDPVRARGKGYYCPNVGMNMTVFNNIFTWAFYGHPWSESLPLNERVDAVRLDIDSLKHVFIQFEQLVQPWAIHKGWDIYSVSGSVTQVAKLCSDGTYVPNVTTNALKEEIVACNYTKPRSWWTGWNSSNYAAGSWASNGWTHAAKNADSWSYYAFQTNKDTVSVADFWFNPDPCAVELNNYLSNPDFTTAQRKDKYDTLLPKYKNTTQYGQRDLSFLLNWNYEHAQFWYDRLKNIITFDCGTKLKCHEKARAVYSQCGSNPGERCKVGDKTYGDYEEALIKYSNVDDSWSLTTFQKITSNAGEISDDIYYKNQWHSTYMKYQRKLTAGFYPTSCAAVICDQNNVDKIWVKIFKRDEKYNQGGYSYSEYFDWLINAFDGQKLMLRTEFWTITGEEGPSCNDVTPCDADPNINNACGENIVLEDYKFGANDDEARKCWQSGFAYTNDRNNPVGSFVKLVGSGDNTCKLYCSEQVSFDLPGEVGKDSAIRAGTIFKWGIFDTAGLSTKNSLLGTMTVTKKCAVRNPQILNAEGERITPNCTGIRFSYLASDWATDDPGTIRTQFRLNYEDPLKEYMYDGLNFVMQRNYSRTDTIKNEKSIVNAQCTNNTCSNLTPEILTTQATYDILYQENLNWYGNKTTGEPESREDIVKKPDGTKLLPWYKWLGYGLPTAFMTPNGTYGADWKDKNGYGDGIFDGMLSLTIGNIGTAYHNFNDYHFDNLIKQKFGDKTITYSCAFRIINELFGNDCKYEEDSMGNLVLTADSPAYCDPKDDDKVEEGKPDPNDPTGGSSTSLRRYIRDIDVVFRVIDLISDSNVAPNGSIIGNAFPGILGEGRVRGRNWAKLSDSEIEDILREDIYQKEPMYSLELNTANIQYIRKLNRDARESKGTYVAADPYTEMRRFNGDNDLTDDSNFPGYTGYYCVNYNGAGATTDTNSADQDIYKYCASRFLSLLASDSFKTHGGERLEGSCVDHNSTAKLRAEAYVKPDSSGNFVGCPRN